MLVATESVLLHVAVVAFSGIVLSSEFVVSNLGVETSMFVGENFM